MPSSSREVHIASALGLPLRGAAGVNQTLTEPGFGPPGTHPQAFGPSWAGALRWRLQEISNGMVEGAESFHPLTNEVMLCGGICKK